MSELEQLATPEEVEMAPMDVLRANLQQEVRKAIEKSDFFVEMTANSEEVKQIAMSVREEIGEYGRLVFPKSKEVIGVNPEQEDLIVYTSMAMIEAQHISEIHRRFVGWLNSTAANRMGLPMVSVPGPEGNINIVPLRTDYNIFRESLIGAFVAAFVEEEMDKRKAKIATLPNAFGNT